MTRTNRFLVCIVGVGFLLMVIPITGYAQVPRTMNFQGYLTDDKGHPLDGTYNIGFSLYDVPTGGTPLWGESQSVTVTQGTYNVILGDGYPLDPEDFAGPLWLGVTVESDPEMTPRLPLTSAGFALRAAGVEQGGVTSVMLADGAVETAKLGDDAVTAQKIASGAVSMSSIEDGATIAEILDDDGATSGLDADLLDGLDSGAFSLSAHSHHSLDASDGSPTNALYVNHEGRVGIGTTSPQGTLHLNRTVSSGSVLVLDRSGSFTRRHIDISANDALNIARTGIADDLTIDATGNVGIGTTSPGKKLTVWGAIKSTVGSDYAVLGESYSGQGVYGYSYQGTGVYSEVITGDGIAVHGSHRGTDGTGGYFSASGNHSMGVDGHSDDGVGVHGHSDNDIGVIGNGVWGVFGSGYGSDGIGVYGSNTAGYAGYFLGPVYVTGYLTKAGGGFRIDHPLDPENKYLNHSFVESPDMKNIYDGNVVLDESGVAWVELPEWFEALNRDFRYQLTCIGGFAQVYIAQEISDNRFKIAGGQPGMKVSWQVSGIRQDPWAEANRPPVEEDKPEDERGSYLTPELYGQSEEKGVERIRHPRIIRQMRETHTMQLESTR